MGQRRGLTKLVALATAAISVAIAMPASALAHKPVGKYFCYSGGAYYGVLKLKASGRYTFNDRYSGKWTYRARTKRIGFTGYFEDFYGKHRHDAEDNNAVVYVLVKGTRDRGYRCG